MPVSDLQASLMSDLIDDPEPGQNAPEFSVTELSGAIKRMIEGEFAFVRVRGEVGRVSRPKSGHVYLDLKDDRAVLSGVIWKGVATGLRTQPQEGMEVVATGRLTTFPGQSRYQIVIEAVAPAGMGALMAMLEKRKAMLAAEGLFDRERKKPLPYLPDVIGVVTSPSGAVIRDILHRLRDRFPRKVLLWPVVVQGERCAAEVANAIRGFNALTPEGALPRPDVLIVARGGGSIEDLWGFNEEIVVRAVAESRIPLISAVGHETDLTLIDYASDQRAPTPTAAAEMAVPVRADLLAHIAGLESRRRSALARGLDQRRQRLRDVARALPRPDTVLSQQIQSLDALTLRLGAALGAGLQSKRLGFASSDAGRFGPRSLERLLERAADRLADRTRSLEQTAGRRLQTSREHLARAAAALQPGRITRMTTDARDRQRRITPGLLRAGARITTEARRQLETLDRLRQTVGYAATLKRGYAVVRGDDDKVITGRKDAAAQARLEIEFADGRFSPGTPAKRPRKATSKDDQGSLF